MIVSDVEGTSILHNTDCTASYENEFEENVRADHSFMLSRSCRMSGCVIFIQWLQNVLTVAFPSVKCWSPICHKVIYTVIFCSAD